MNRPCSKAITCPGPIPGLEGDSPITNYSSEANDGPEFTGIVWPTWDENDPGRPGWWARETCGGVFLCTSFISQADADECAARLAAICAWTPPQLPDYPNVPRNCEFDPASCVPPMVPTTTGPVGNDFQSCSIKCPDNTYYFYAVRAGQVVAQTKSLANQLAYALACQRVTQVFICLQDIAPGNCLGEGYDSNINALGNGGPFTFSIIAGALPPGMLLLPRSGTSARISGVCSQTGTYNFTVQAVSFDGYTAQKTYTISVMSLTDPEVLPQAILGAAYNHTISLSGGVAPFTYSVVSGDLPIGFTLDSATGVISGNTSVAGTSSFNVQVTDANGLSCTKLFSIEAICVIATLAFPTGNVASWYEEQLSVLISTPSDVWAIVAGALPSGLLLNATTGLIYGVPDTIGASIFTVSYSNGDGAYCEKEFIITIDAATGPDWTTLTWVPLFVNPAGPGYGSAAASPDNGPSASEFFSLSVSDGRGISFTHNAKIAAYTGPPCSCEFRLKTTVGSGFVGAPSGNLIRVTIIDAPEGPEWYYYHWAGSVDVIVPFTLGVHIADDIEVRLDGGGASQVPIVFPPTPGTTFDFSSEFWIYNV